MHNYESGKTAPAATASPNASPIASKTRVGVIGARGYAGLDLCRILLRHPAAELKACFGTDSTFALSEYLPEASARAIAIQPAKELEKALPDLDIVFLATPAETSLELAPKLVQAGVKVIDLSGAFRLKTSSYREWYGFEHTSLSLLEETEFGLVPFTGPATGARLVANPGCYATAILMGLIPLLKAGVILPESLVVDAKSGTSGAGRKASEGLLFTEVEGECLPYKIGKHQHFPEIQEYAAKFGGVKVDPLLSTHLLNTRRGIIAGLYARLAPGKTEEHVAQAYASAFEGYPLARVASASQKASAQLLSLKRVVGSARTHITHSVHGDKLYIYSCIDNLLKGAASQAVENFNRLRDLSPATGLIELEGVL